MGFNSGYAYIIRCEFTSNTIFFSITNKKYHQEYALTVYSLATYQKFGKAKKRQ